MANPWQIILRALPEVFVCVCAWVRAFVRTLRMQTGACQCVWACQGVLCLCVGGLPRGLTCVRGEPARRFCVEGACNKFCMWGRFCMCVGGRQGVLYVWGRPAQGFVCVCAMGAWQGVLCEGTCLGVLCGSQPVWEPSWGLVCVRVGENHSSPIEEIDLLESRTVPFLELRKITFLELRKNTFLELRKTLFSNWEKHFSRKQNTHISMVSAFFCALFYWEKHFSRIEENTFLELSKTFFSKEQHTSLNGFCAFLRAFLLRETNFSIWETRFSQWMKRSSLDFRNHTWAMHLWFAVRVPLSCLWRLVHATVVLICDHGQANIPAADSVKVWADSLLKAAGDKQGSKTQSKRLRSLGAKRHR